MLTGRRIAVNWSKRLILLRCGIFTTDRMDRNGQVDKALLASFVLLNVLLGSKILVPNCGRG